MPKTETQEEEVVYGVKVDRELIKWEKKDKKETVTIELSVSLTQADSKGMVANLRKEINSLITGLSRDLANTKLRSGDHKVIQISLEEVPNRPYKRINIAVGEEVPDVPWSSGPTPEELKDLC